MQFFTSLHHTIDEWIADMHAEWSQTHFRRGDYEKSVEAANQALDCYERLNIFDDNMAYPADAYFTRGRAKTMLGDFDGALADLDTCLTMLTRQPMKRAAVYAYRALVYWKLGDIVSAISDANLALYFDPCQRIASTVRRMAEIAQLATLGRVNQTVMQRA